MPRVMDAIIVVLDTIILGVETVHLTKQHSKIHSAHFGINLMNYLRSIVIEAHCVYIGS